MTLQAKSKFLNFPNNRKKKKGGEEESVRMKVRYGSHSKINCRESCSKTYINQQHGLYNPVQRYFRKSMWWNETGKWSRYLSLGSELFIVLKYFSLPPFALRKTHLTDVAGFYLVTGPQSNEGHLLFVVALWSVNPSVLAKDNFLSDFAVRYIRHSKISMVFTASLSQFVFMIAHQTIEWKTEESAE